MITRLHALFGLILFTACQKTGIEPTTPCQPTDHSAHARHAELSAVLNDYIAENKLPGAIIAVHTIGSEPWIGAQGMANLETGSPMLTCTRFRTGSITKTFIGTLALQLQEDGVLHLNDRLSQHLPNVDVPEADRITLRQLLNHSSGLRHPSDDDLGYQLRILNDPEGMATMSIERKLEQYVYGRPLLFDPGEGIHYSNAGYWLLQRVMERRTGRSLRQLLHERITGPLGMPGTYLASGDDAHVARGYHFNGFLLNDVTHYDRADSDNDPAGGIVSTAADLLSFGQALFGGELISAASLEEMKQVSTYPDGDDAEFVYGLGIETWDTNGGTHGYGKNGSLTGVDANWIHFPSQQTTVVIFTNKGGGSHKDFIDRLVP